MKRCLVLGSSGMAGSVVATCLSEQGHDVTRIAGSRKVTPDTILMDLTDEDALSSFLSHDEFDVVINCVGVLLGDCERDPAQAIYLNAYLPKYLERRFRRSRTKVIHLSTDCVFSGENGPYREDSRYDGTLLYDRCKALGEINNDKDLTFRMSIIGPELKVDGSGLFHWFMQQQGEVHGYTNVIWSGITTTELAKGVVAAIEQDLAGIYHLVPEASISKCDLLNVIQSVFPESRATVTPKRVAPSDRTLLNARKDFEHAVPAYEQMIREMREWMEARAGSYAQYRIGGKRAAHA
jgi:dTDP-4-dehydrorhamnose reductase